MSTRRLVLAALIAVTFATGCSSNDDEVNALRQQVASLQSQVEQTQSKLDSLQKRYPVAAIARAAKVTPMAVWSKLKETG